MKIYVYGTGCGAGDLVDAALPAERIEAFVDREGGGSFLGRPVISLEQLAGREFELLIVTSREAERVERDCLRLGLAPEKLLFLKNHLAPVERNRSYDTARSVLGDAFVDRLIGSERLIRVPLWTETERIAGPGSDNDYVRLKTLEALCLRLDGVPGAAAELGVYRGGFARWISELLPDRRFFLFDTFEGFDPAESAGESAGFTEAHRNTSVERVLAALPHPENAVICQGLFPQTAQGLERECFALVSLDADLEESTLAGLRFFWPRMSAGGYLLLHDCSNPRLPGVRRALARFEAEYGRLAAVPLCDVNGTLVLAK
ncbi:MAG: class I SAM-dependent methyltransferase [Oscillospiraceae bacterium]|nr:class I SAM-dependent methyltransferase [Oscillospiraceae bacterium]